jgi:hypothetical protein
MSFRIICICHLTERRPVKLVNLEARMSGIRTTEWEERTAAALSLELTGQILFKLRT